MATLLAALMTYSRLSSDSELIALRSCGVSIYRLVPAFILSFVVTGMTFLFNEQVVPAANYQAHSKSSPEERKGSVSGAKHFLSRIPEVTVDGSKERFSHAYADQFDGQREKA